MSLDVYLELENALMYKEEDTGVRLRQDREMSVAEIWIREEGQTKKISAEKWNKVRKGEPLVLESIVEKTVYSANITHNLGAKAREAGIYEYLWRPDENKITQAKELIPHLKVGLATLEKNPEKFKQFNPSNGWGTYMVLVEFIKNYLIACQEYPEAKVRVSR